VLCFANLNNPHDIHNIPNLMYHPGPHGRGSFQRHMDLAEIVVHEMQRYGVRMVLSLLAKGICQSGEPTHMHPHG
jgi:hypothetical protein